MSGRPGSSFPVDPAECWRSSKSALELFTGLGDRAAEAIVQTGLAQLRAQQSQYTQALEHAKESPRLRHALGADTAIDAPMFVKAFFSVIWESVGSGFAERRTRQGWADPGVGG